MYVNYSIYEKLAKAVKLVVDEKERILIGYPYMVDEILSSPYNSDFHYVLGDSVDPKRIRINRTKKTMVEVIIITPEYGLTFRDYSGVNFKLLKKKGYDELFYLKILQLIIGELLNSSFERLPVDDSEEYLSIDRRIYNTTDKLVDLLLTSAIIL